MEPSSYITQKDTYPFYKRIWKQFPEVLGFNNTYKTNRHKIPLFQITSTTDISSLYNYAFGLVSTERKEGYNFLIKSFNEIHTEGDGSTPADEYDVNRDKEAVEAEAAAAAKATQEARKAEAAILNDPQAQALNEVGRANRVLSKRQLNALIINHTPTSFTELWAYVMYADTEEDFNTAWARLQDEFTNQEPTLNEYKNYSVRTNSPTETAHKDLKSYIISGHSDLLSVSQAINEMLQNKEHTYSERVAKIEKRSRREYLSQPWLTEISKKLGCKALKLLTHQHHITLTAKPEDSKPPPPDLQPYRSRFTHQFKLPYSHKILKLEKDSEKLTIYDVNPR
ncbi:hypothetical protein K4K48_012083 [Colletotrichum sp. SAR 10_66]|nr:hypothetical protein K4K48_012083 [Colletotrichum sp. SAR 10_66]